MHNRSINIHNNNNEVDSPSNDPSSPQYISPSSTITMRSPITTNSFDVLSLVFTPQWHQSDFKVTHIHQLLDQFKVVTTKFFDFAASHERLTVMPNKPC
jgi:hypothetical protein